MAIERAQTMIYAFRTNCSVSQNLQFCELAHTEYTVLPRLLVLGQVPLLRYVHLQRILRSWSTLASSQAMAGPTFGWTDKLATSLTS